MTKKPDPYYIEGARSDAEPAEEVPVEWSNPAKVFLNIVEDAGIYVDREAVDAMAAFYDAPATVVQLDIEGPSGWLPVFPEGTTAH